MQLAIEFEAVSKVFARGVCAVRDCSFSVQQGEWLVLLGPSGCGKTTTLRLIAGLERPTAGQIRLHGTAANELPPDQRGVTMLFQRPALFPNRTVAENLAFPLELNRRRLPWWGKGLDRATESRVRETAAWLRIDSLLDRYPRELSGGQQQRVALGRALIRGTPIGLLDEPLGHLDAPLRKELRGELPLLRGRFPATMVVVTHDPAEALALGDRIGVFVDGRLVQLDRPAVLRQAPCDAYVAGLFDGV